MQNPTLCFDTNFELNISQWYNFAVVIDATGNTGYLDGVELTSRHYNFNDASSPEFLDDLPVLDTAWIGRGFLSSLPQDQYFPGAIDELLIYDRPLSGTELGNYYNSVTAAVPEPSTLAMAVISLLGLGLLGLRLRRTAP